MEMQWAQGPEGAVADAVVMTADEDGESYIEEVQQYLMAAHDLSEDTAAEWIGHAKRSGEIVLRPFQVPVYAGHFFGTLNRCEDDRGNEVPEHAAGTVRGEAYRYVYDFMVSVPCRPVDHEFQEAG